MTRHWTVSIDGGVPVHLDLAQYAAAIERAKQEGKPGRVMIEVNSKNCLPRKPEAALGPPSSVCPDAREIFLP
jgi:hypothetical protein